MNDDLKKEILEELIAAMGNSGAESRLPEKSGGAVIEISVGKKPDMIDDMGGDEEDDEYKGMDTRLKKILMEKC